MENSNNNKNGSQDIKNNFKWSVFFKKMDSDDIKRSFLNKLEYNIAKDKFTFTRYDGYLSLAYTIRDYLIERWIITQQQYYKKDPKRVYYFSLEFLLGRLLGNNIINLGLNGAVHEAMKNLGVEYDECEDQEADAGLGNGGLGRLAACFLDSMASMELPAVGYGILYEFGIFNQKIVNGYQKELPEQWLQNVNPWMIERPEFKVRVKFYGKVLYENGGKPNESGLWTDTADILAVPFDIPICGYKSNTVNNLRLWSARSPMEIDFDRFQVGDYIAACESKTQSENISKVLYPNDAFYSGKELRLKQQYFFTSASLQDILRRYLKIHHTFDVFADKNAIQLNDTHPTIAIVELMRLFIDVYGLAWDKAWEIVTKTFAYTNHTLLPEALEKVPVSLLQNLLPRHMDLIYKINLLFLREISTKFPNDNARYQRMSIIEEGGEKLVRMAFLAVVGSHSVNGVSQLHSTMLTQGILKDFYELWPHKFNNKTNGITQRRWLYKANEKLSELITEKIGDGWINDLQQLEKLQPYAQDEDFLHRWQQMKRRCKKRMTERLNRIENINITIDTMFDVQLKRLHEYKRQLLNVFHCIHLYNEIKAGKTDLLIPRTVFLGGKAAPSYYMAKLIIKFINNVGAVINRDPAVGDYLKVYFIPNYQVTLAEYMIPGAELSQQISTAGTEASGTGNMKFALNGALTMGTMDGANIEMSEEIGVENMFIFGMRADGVAKLRSSGYHPRTYYEKSEPLKKVIDLINADTFSPREPHLFKPIIDSLLNEDRFMVLADFESYCQCQRLVSATYKKTRKWNEMSILNVANMGKFSSDRTIREYAEDIWHVKSLPIELDR